METRYDELERLIAKAVKNKKKVSHLRTQRDELVRSEMSVIAKKHYPASDGYPAGVVDLRKGTPSDVLRAWNSIVAELQSKGILGVKGVIGLDSGLGKDTTVIFSGGEYGKTALARQMENQLLEQGKILRPATLGPADDQDKAVKFIRCHNCKCEEIMMSPNEFRKLRERDVLKDRERDARMNSIANARRPSGGFWPGGSWNPKPKTSLWQRFLRAIGW